jgi:hypothetical protein
MDARLFFDLAVERGFVEPVLLLGERATCAAVRAQIAEMAAISEPGDLFLLTFSGHGGRTRLRSREVGTWQLYDGTLNDEQLTAGLAQFRQGVRVLVVSDNCGGGIPGGPQSPGGWEASQVIPQGMPQGIFKASVLVLAACGEGKYADGPGLPGHFAAAIKRALNVRGTYEAFHQALCHEMPSYQKPDYYRLGAPSPAFEAQQPFTI